MNNMVSHKNLLVIIINKFIINNKIVINNYKFIISWYKTNPTSLVHTGCYVAGCDLLMTECLILGHSNRTRYMHNLKKIYSIVQTWGCHMWHNSKTAHAKLTHMLESKKEGKRWKIPEKGLFSLKLMEKQFLWWASLNATLWTASFELHNSALHKRWPFQYALCELQYSLCEFPGCSDPFPQRLVWL